MLKITSLLFLLSLTLTIKTFSQTASHGDEYALDGYDLTTCFEESPIKGHRLISYDYNGPHLLFTSDENIRKFINNPEKFMPAYGGWCATAIVYDELVKPNFSLYIVQDEQLLFFEVKAFFNDQTHWEKDPDYNMQLANAQYDKMQC